MEFPAHDPSIPRCVEVGFNRLISLFRILDKPFLVYWNEQEDPRALEDITIEWIESKQAQLDKDEASAIEDDRKLQTTGHGALTEFQHADLFITRLWLRTLVWQLALSRGFLRSAPLQNTHEGLSLQFPAQSLSTQLRGLVGRLESVASISTQGSGIMQKLFEITSTIADVLALPLGHSQTEEDVKPQVEDFVRKYINAVLAVDVELVPAGSVTLELSGTDKNQVATAGKISFTLEVQNPSKWTAETPYVYCAVLILEESKQTVCERVGFRRVEIKDGAITVNGRRIVLKGITRYEHHLRFGRAVPFEFMRNDLVQMKMHNIKAIRTSHSPNDVRRYSLADELGLWVMDEADLESSGFFYVELAALTEEERKMSKKGVVSLECGRATEWITNKPEWTHAFVDRAKQMVMHEKNHYSLIIWSLGNESYDGTNTTAMDNWVKSYDSTRPIYHPGDREAEVVDMYSLMYPEAAEVLELEKTSPMTKPILLCEYLYVIGNGAGGIWEYVELFYKYPRLYGGFAWQWASRGLETSTSTSDHFYGYGGDFGDIINDGREMTHGYNFSDHTAKPALMEYKKAPEPVQLISGSFTSFSLINRHDFVDLDTVKCEWSIIGDGFRTEHTEAALL
ncbi:Fc.00g073770.m01.CDS01 [Cosmosporella sp. VM-42]